MSTNFPYKIRYEYTIDPSNSPSLTHGVWGGISPHNEIEMNFYVESNKIPASVEQFVSPDGSLEHKHTNIDETMPTITRHIHSKIVMNREVARSIIEWLQRKVAILDMEEGEVNPPFHSKAKLEQ